MAFHPGKRADVLINEFTLSAFFNNADLSRDVNVPETSTFGVNDRTYIVGLRGGTVSLAGYFDETAVTGSDVVLNATLGVAAARLVTVGPIGLVIGDPVYMFTTHSTSYGVSAPVDGVVAITADLQATAEIDRGLSQHDNTAEVATADSASIDNLASSANGGIASLHVTAINTGTTLDVDIEDGTDDIVFVSLISFAQVTTTTTSESLTVSGTVDQYTRSAHVIVGTSYTFATAFARR